MAADIERKDDMFDTNTTKCSCGCCGNNCGFNPCAVTCEACVKSFGDYAYIYNTTAQTVADGEAFSFSANGPLSGAITHTAGTAQIVIGKTGVYMAEYYINGTDTETTATVYRNGEALEGATYAADSGQLIIAAQIGDVITLVNTGEAEVTLTPERTASEAVVNASMTLVRLF